MKKRIDYAFVTDVGKVRKNNEDRTVAKDYGDVQLQIVCDGMGGHRKGEVASELAISTIISFFDSNELPSNEYRAKKMLKKVLKEANSLINKLSSQDERYADMGTTVVLALSLPTSTIIVNCGDSRAYSYSKSQGLKLLTTDQTYVQYLYDMGKITKEEMYTRPDRHVLMNAMGINPSIEYDTIIIPNDYDSLLLVSDGFSNMVSFDEIELYMSLDMSTLDKTSTMLNRALAKGGIDNIAINLLEVKL